MGPFLPGEGPVGLRLHGNRESIRAVVRDPQNDRLLWLATAAGVARFDVDTEDWTYLDRTTGLSTQTVDSLLLDNRTQELWAAGWKGISVLSKEESSWAVVADEVYQMHKRHVQTIVLDTDDSDALLFTTPEGVFRFHRGSGAWQWVGLPEPPKALVPLKSNGLWAVVTEQGVYQLDARNGALHSRLPADEARRVIGEPADGSYGVRLTSATTLGSDRIAISTVSDGVFFFDLATGELSYPPFNSAIVGDCTSPKLFRAGSRWLLHGGPGCWGELSPSREEIRPLPPLPVAGIRDLQTHADEPDRLWIGTNKGLLSFDLGTGEPTWFLPPGTGPGTNGWDLEEVDGKLFFAASDGVLGFRDLEPTTSEWQSIPGLCRVLGLFPGLGNDLFVLGGIECLGQQELWTFTLDPPAYEPLPLPWDDLISFPYDLFADENWLWMIGPDYHDGPFLLVALSKDEERVLHLAEASAPRKLLPSAFDPSAMWFLAGERLTRLEKETFSVETVRTGTRDGGVLADGRFWIQEATLMIFDPRDRSTIPLEATGQPIADPLDKDRLWLLQDHSLAVASVTSGQIKTVTALPENLYVRDVRMTLTGAPRLWLSTNEGLLEIYRETQP